MSTGYPGEKVNEALGHLERQLDEIFKTHHFKAMGKEDDYIFQALAFLGEASSKVSIARTILRDNHVILHDQKLAELQAMQRWLHDFSDYLRDFNKEV